MLLERETPLGHVFPTIDKERERERVCVCVYVCVVLYVPAPQTPPPPPPSSAVHPDILATWMYILGSRQGKREIGLG